MRPYRIKHKPTGLYYKPSSKGTNLSKEGKVYISHGNFLTYSKWDRKAYIDITPKQYEELKYTLLKDGTPPELYNSGIIKKSVHLPKEDFEIEYL
jgi:hypothetical protein|nr:MAG TPA: hypothetical protein [Crassvirales sp.]